MTRPINRVRILALDIDGTTIRPDGTVSKRVQQAIQSAREAGVQVVLCTGRAFHTGVGPLASSIGLTVAREGEAEPQAIVNNGGASVDLRTEHVRWERLIPEEHVGNLLEAIVQVGATPLVEQAPSDGGKMFTWADHVAHPAAKLFAHAWMRIDDIVAVGPEVLSHVAVRTGWMGACGDYLTTQRAHEALVRLAGSHPEFDVFWSADWLAAGDPNHVAGVRPLGVNKSHGLATFAAEFGTDLSACVAIGDEMNDFEMLRDVGFGIAMGQAPDSLKSVAKAITRSNIEDGVSEAIARWVLPFA